MTLAQQYFISRPVIDHGIRVIVEGATWWDLAACRGMDTEIFYYKDTFAGPAKRICKGCPVQSECLEDAMAREPVDHRHGVWGGLSSGERHRLWKKMQKARQTSGT